MIIKEVMAHKMGMENPSIEVIDDNFVWCDDVEWEEKLESIH